MSEKGIEFMKYINTQCKVTLLLHFLLNSQASAIFLGIRTHSLKVGIINVKSNDNEF